MIKYKAGVAPDDMPGYQHLVTGEGFVRKKAQVVGGHNIDSFYEAIKQDAQNLGLNISDHNIKIIEHPTIKGLYQIEYSIPRVNGNVSGFTVQATINGITFKGYYRNGVLTYFFPIFE